MSGHTPWSKIKRKSRQIRHEEPELPLDFHVKTVELNGETFYVASCKQYSFVVQSRSLPVVFEEAGLQIRQMRALREKFPDAAPMWVLLDADGTPAQKE